MIGRERDHTPIASFEMPAVYRMNTWAYGRLRFVVTDRADHTLVEHITRTIRD